MRLVQNAARWPGFEGVSVVVGESCKARAVAWIRRADELVTHAAWTRALAHVGVAPA